jgi:hypothetical protein
MLDFKIKKLDNISFNFQELTEYYAMLKSDYQKLKWWPKDSPVEQGYGWAIQSKFWDPTIPCPCYHFPWDEGKDCNNNFDTPTELVFGFADKILKNFKNAKQTILMVHGAGTTIDFHIDKEVWLAEEHLKIHVPIESNDKSYFQFDDEEFVLSPGSMYLVNTTLNHGTANLGLNERAHLIFKIPMSSIESILTQQLVL